MSKKALCHKYWCELSGWFSWCFSSVDGWQRPVSKNLTCKCCWHDRISFSCVNQIREKGSLPFLFSLHILHYIDSFTCIEECGNDIQQCCCSDWSGCTEMGSAWKAGQELSPACPSRAGCALGVGRKAVSSDMGRADAAPGQGMGWLAFWCFSWVSVWFTAAAVFGSAVLSRNTSM